MNSSGGMQKYILFVGNPGVGKSTLLNSLIGRVEFMSGLNFGEGMTYQLDERIVGDTVYLDTPGLADINRREAAARAINAALKKNGQYRLFFVLTTESGRLRPGDLATMELVLNAIEVKGVQHAVIINKLSRNAMEELEIPDNFYNLVNPLKTGADQGQQCYKCLEFAQ
jgi:GTPase Era involved in 16S rRNA processing